MAEKFLEENRYLYVESKLGPNALLLESFTGSEGISQLFSFQLELLSENKRIKFEDILGKEISFGVAGTDSNDPPRCVHGIVTAFAQLPDSIRLSRYRAIVSPKLWILTRKQNCRIFQTLAVPDILKILLDGIDVAWELQGSYSPREYCVQYRETDFNFLSRLMEEEGIFYFFRFAKDAHKLVISDNKASHHDMPGQSSLIYDEVAGGGRDETRISNWTKTQELGPGKFSMQDYNFETPQTDLQSSQDILPSALVGKVTHKLKVGGNDNFEIYDYPGGYENKNQGKDVTKHAMELLEMSQFVILGESNVYYLTPGYRFTLTNHSSAEGSYILTSATHSASEGGFHSGSDIGQNHYSNSFRSIPYSMLYRPPQTATRPHVGGCQTAVVVGPSGEEIYADKYGRVKVQFHWDRKGQHDQSSSCWIRVATHWAGHGWGAIQLPRIGQEVVVDFLEGDPDRPIVVGSVYNAANMPPYELPANKTQSGIMSDSSPRSGGYNQIRFEDMQGKEEILVHAQKDMNTKVEHDQTLVVNNNRNASINRNDTTTIGGDKSLSVQGDRTASINGSDSKTVSQDSTVSVMGSESRTVGMNRTIDITASDTLTAGGTITISSSGLTISAPTIVLNAAMVQVSGVVQCTNLIASAGVVSPAYTPGAGNIM
ncbi:MAG TPA: type VI secretion system tip protein TssI/VgrG [Acidobacteriota bacterium]|nr:type VI secretion system tip protein TssI/VgrG [Acidobacteriota bacterium]